MKRFILHSDLTNFYASVECMENPELSKFALVVCGDASKRHGIVLAKNQIAKKLGIKTGDTIWEAEEKCKGSSYEFKAITADLNKYYAISKKVKDIYKRHSDNVESFGIDEAWIDLSRTVSNWSDAVEIARKIYEDVLNELGLVVYIGVSFNKIFAKFGSDMKDESHVFIITKGNFKKEIWKLTCDQLLFVGRATNAKLKRYNLNTIGDIANCNPEFLKKILGKNGYQIWLFANGLDESEVMKVGVNYPIKSIGNSVTCPIDLKTKSQIESVVFTLCESVVKRARVHDFWTKEIQVHIKTSNLQSFERQTQLEYPTNNVHDIAIACLKLIYDKYDWTLPIRALGVRLKSFCEKPTQLNMFVDNEMQKKHESIDKTIEKIRDKYGENIIKRAVVMENEDLRLLDPQDTLHKIHPVGYKV